MDIPLLGIVGEDITVEAFQSNLQQANNKDITLLIDSPGGDVFAGMAISNLIKDYKGNVEARILGLAGSIMTVITSSADVVNISETASFMIHNALTPMTGGNAEELRETANALEQISNTINSVYQARTGLEGKDLQALMDEETIMTAQEAVALGFADNIVNELKAVALINTDMSKLNELKLMASAVGKRLGIQNETEIPEEVEQALDEEIKEAVEEGIKEAEETETELEALSEMVSQKDFQTYKAEILALLKPVLDAMDEVPSKEEMEEEVNAKTTNKIHAVLQAMKSKTQIPSASADFAPVVEEKSDRLKHGFLAAKQKELRTKNGH